MRIAVTIVVGLVLAVVMQLVAYACAGLGHGWVTPFLYSLLGFVAFPIVFAAATTKAPAVWALVVLLVAVIAGVALDAMIYRGTLAEGVEYFHKTEGGGQLWIALWLSWQVVAVLRIAAEPMIREHRVEAI